MDRNRIGRRCHPGNNFCITTNRASHTPVADRGAGTIKGDNEISTRNGSKTHLVFAGWNPGMAKCQRPYRQTQNFGDVLREGQPYGRSLFDVARNAEKPFLITTARIDIKVLGTIQRQILSDDQT